MRNLWSRFWSLRWLVKGPIIAFVALIVLALAVPSPEEEADAEVAATAASTEATITATAAATESATQEPTETPTPTPTSTPTPEPGFGDGTWLVGTDIEPGRYRATDGRSCYWERLAGLSGSFSDIIANGNEDGASAVVDVAETDRAFSTERCGRWTQLEAAATSAPDAPFADGVWVVGLDIAPGTWRSAGADSCYWERLADFSGTFDGILANDNVTGPAIVEILPTDVGFRAQRCGEWTKVE